MKKLLLTLAILAISINVFSTENFTYHRYVNEIGKATKQKNDIHFKSDVTAKPYIEIENVNADATGNYLVFTKDSASPAANDVLANILFTADDVSGNRVIAGSVEVQGEDVSSSSYDCSISFSTMKADTLTETLKLESGDVTFPGAATITGTLTAGTLTDGTATITSGAIASVTTLGMSGALSGASSITTSGALDSLSVTSEKYVLDTVQTFVDEDTTPDVGLYSYFNTNTTATVITDFDGTGIEDGHFIVVISKGDITYGVTANNIIGGTTDIITADGDITSFLYDGTDWRVVSRIDQSDDLN